MLNHREDYAKKSLYLGHFFGGITTFEAITYTGLRLSYGELSPQTSSFIHFSLLSLFSFTLMSYSYYFGYKSGNQVQNAEVQQLKYELDKKNKMINDYKSQLDTLEAFQHEQMHPNTPRFVHSDTESYEILDDNDAKHFKAS